VYAAGVSMPTKLQRQMSGDLRCTTVSPKIGKQHMNALDQTISLPFAGHIVSVVVM
jgi:hypothetical protein